MRKHGLRRGPAIGTGLLLAVLWYALWQLAALAGVSCYTSLWYPPAGLTLAAALVLPPRHWAVFVVMVAGGTALGREPGVWLDAPFRHAVLVLLQGAAHGLPFYLGARLLRRRVAGDRESLLMAILLSLPVMTAGSAGLGTLVVVAAGGSDGGAPWAMFTAWFTGDLLGAATTAPLLTLVLPGWLRRTGLEIDGAAPDDGWRPPSRHGLALVLLTFGALAVMAARPPFAAAPGGVTIWLYPVLLGMLLIGRLETARHAAAVLALASFFVVVAGERAGLDPARGEPHLLLLALAVLAQLGIALRNLREERDRDALTGVLARTAWRRLATARLRRAGGWTVAMVDLDGFKAINDGFGHASGDAVLCRVAHVLQTRGPEGTLVGRLGGDEFVLLLPGDAEAAARTAQRLRRALAAGAPVAGGPSAGGPSAGGPRARSELPDVTASFGLAATLPGESLDGVLERADQALLRAKGGGRDRVVGAARTAAPAGSGLAPALRR